MFYRIFSEQNPVNVSVKAFKRYSMFKPVILILNFSNSVFRASLRGALLGGISTPTWKGQRRRAQTDAGCYATVKQYAQWCHSSATGCKRRTLRNIKIIWHFTLLPVILDFCSDSHSKCSGNQLFSWSVFST